MPNSEKFTSNKRLFIDYVPAELKQTAGNDWRVVFYVKKPGKEKLKRFRRRVPPLKNKIERERLAKRMCANINEKLLEGWSPFYEGSGQNSYKSFISVLDQFLQQNKRKLKDQMIRKDSYRAYLSFTNNIKKYLEETSKEKMLAVEFTRSFAIQFIDHIYFERKRSARTSNNYLSFLNQIGIFMEERKYLPKNPVQNISKRKVAKKKREILPGWLRNDIFKYWKLNSKAYLTLCLTTYFCFIRRTELTKLKVKHVNLFEGIIFVPGSASKNGKDGTVTIPKRLRILLAEHLSKSENSDYLFSNNNYLPGKNRLKPKKISDEWAKMRNEMDVDSKYQFYSLKDTGITNLLLLGIPAKKVRDQARHHDIRITESYVARTEKADEELLNIDFNF